MSWCIAGSVEIIRWAKSKGWRVTAEVTPHHLLLTDALAVSYDPVYKVNPPLRTQADVEAKEGAVAVGAPRKLPIETVPSATTVAIPLICTNVVAGVVWVAVAAQARCATPRGPALSPMPCAI